MDLRKFNLTEIDLTPLRNTPRISRIYLSSNRLKTIDLSPLQHCPRLYRLDLDDNQLETIDLSPLAGCEKLEDLSLEQNRLGEIDLSPLQHCPQLREIQLGQNQLTHVDLTPLQHCSNLTSLWIASNQLTEIDLFPLRKCSHLKSIILHNNPLIQVNVTILHQSPYLRSVHVDNDVQVLAPRDDYFNEIIGAPWLWFNHEIERSTTPPVDVEAILQRAKEFARTRVDPLFEQGLDLFETKDWDAAKKKFWGAYHWAIQLDNASLITRLLQLIGMCLSSQGFRYAPRSYFQYVIERAISLNDLTSLVSACLSLAQEYLSLNERKAAEETYDTLFNELHRLKPQTDALDSYTKTKIREVQTWRESLKHQEVPEREGTEAQHFLALHAAKNLVKVYGSRAHLGDFPPDIQELSTLSREQQRKLSEQKDEALRKYGGYWVYVISPTECFEGRLTRFGSSVLCCPKGAGTHSSKNLPLLTHQVAVTFEDYEIANYRFNDEIYTFEIYIQFSERWGYDLDRFLCFFMQLFEELREVRGVSIIPTYNDEPYDGEGFQYNWCLFVTIQGLTWQSKEALKRLEDVFERFWAAQHSALKVQFVSLREGHGPF